MTEEQQDLQVADVFISYRRDETAEAARAIQLALRQSGVSVYLDVENLTSGHFDEQLLRVIETTPNFVLLLAPQSLDRCSDTEDWLKREIVHSLQTRRNVVPVLLNGFRFPPEEHLPETMRPLLRHHAVTYRHEYFEATMERILQSLDFGKDTTAPTGQLGGGGDGRREARRPRYLFLGIDGVLRPYRTEPYELDSPCLSRFEAVIREYPEVRIVITSRWRLGLSLDQMRAYFSRDIAIRIVGVAPEATDRRGPYRSREVHQYLDTIGDAKTSWIAVDASRSPYGPGESIVVTEPYRGFDKEAARSLRHRLSG